MKYVIIFLLVIGMVSAGSVVEDRQALEALYISTAGDSWTQNSGWMSASNLSDWYGVETDSSGRVVRLDLFDNNLVGELPAEIGLLDSVEYLNVKQNELVGFIPDSIGDLASVEWLLLAGVPSPKDPEIRSTKASHPGKTNTATNRFTGVIPSTIDGLSSLQVLELSGQLLTGGIPEEIGALSELRGLHMSWNRQLNGTIPDSITQLKKLNKLYLSYNQLTGSIPALGKLPDLRQAWFDANQLSGEFPDMRGAFLLQEFSIHRNDISGEFPAYWGNGSYPNLIGVQASWNDLTGTLPAFENLTKISQFSVAGNNLHGPIPPSIVNASRMIIFQVGWNNLNGTLPALGWSNWTNLRYVQVSHNNLHGSLPDDLPNGRDLYFHENDFTSLNPEPFIDLVSVSDKISSVNIGSNRLTFQHIVPLIQPFSTSGVSLNYRNQKPFGMARVQTVANGSSASLVFPEISHSDNVYQWFKDEEMLSGATSRVLELSSVNSSHEGVYTLEVSNPFVSDLMLFSEELTLAIGEPEEQEEFDTSLYASPRSGFVVSDSVRVSDTVVFSTGYFSDDGFSWEPFSFSGETRGDWVVGDALSSSARLDARYYAVFSCSWVSGWNCSDTWQVLER